MSDTSKEPSLEAWTRLWADATSRGVQATQAFAQSAWPFFLGRMAEPGGEGVNQMGEAIERLAQGPRLSDVWDIDRKFYAAMAAWLDLRAKLAVYSTTTATPWQSALKRYSETVDTEADEDWRKAFGKWSAIANEELIRNQRSESFLNAQRELLRATLEFKQKQQALTETMTTFLGLPTQQDLDEVTRQLTELRREVRAHIRETRETKAADPAPAKPSAPASPRPAAKKSTQSKPKPAPGSR